MTGGNSVLIVQPNEKWWSDGSVAIVTGGASNCRQRTAEERMKALGFLGALLLNAIVSGAASGFFLELLEGAINSLHLLSSTALGAKLS